MKINKDSLTLIIKWMSYQKYIFEISLKNVVMGVCFYIFLKNTPITSKYIRFYI